MVVSDTNIHSIHDVTLLFLFNNEWNGCLSHQQPFATFLFYVTHLLLHYSWDCLTATTAQMLEQTCISYNEVCNFYHTLRS